MKVVTYHICEFGIIRSKENYLNIPNTLKELYLPKKYFDQLYEYISQSQDQSAESEKPFVLFSKGKKRQIRVKNYVGIIETSEGLQLEILPKIHLTRTSNELNDTKKIFLKMLRHLSNSPFINISNAHLNSQENFPILEVFISSYIIETERIFKYGVKSDYILTEDNIGFLKGKLKVNENIKHNFLKKQNFYCEFSEYSSNIYINRLIKTTLLKLRLATRSSKNIFTINKLISHLENVTPFKSIKVDLFKASNGNRLFSEYESLLLWSEIFLTNRSFTNYQGDNSNLAILFPMEKIFEDYIAHLFKKYSNGYKIKTQDRSYFLVTHRNLSKFFLKPDLVIDKQSTRQKIIDTKWKLLDDSATNRNYNISSADMYQLYAYGKKYSTSSSEPKLILLYPSNSNFTNKLEPFIYEGALQLEVYPFDFNKNEKDQIESILNL